VADQRMIRYIIRRLLGMVVVVVVVSFLTFALFYIVPGWFHIDVVRYFVAKIPPDPRGLEALRHRLGFDQAWYAQYGNFLKGLVAGKDIDDGTGQGLVHCSAPCFGTSIRQKVSVNSLILSALPVSLSLVIGAAILWLIGGITVGTISGTRPGSFFDRAGMSMSLAAVSLPIFFTGPILLLVFSYKLGWLADINYTPITQNPISWARNLILAWIALAFLFAALYARLTRANMMEVMGEDYIRTARAKGLPNRTVILKHGLRSALTPIVTIFGIDLGTLIGSTVITEKVFNLRGLGTLTIRAVTQQDLPVILGTTIVAALFVVVANFLVDIGYGIVDPRVSYS
jgi:peptide/nickel transport system permease protein